MKGVIFLFDFNTNHFDLGVTAFVVILSAIILALQFFLCYKTQKLLLKLIPLALCTVSLVLFSVLSTNVGGWDALGYLFFAIFSFGLIFVCGIGWGMAIIVKKLRNQTP